MQDYLKKHETQAAYTTWKASNDYVTPNVSLISGDVDYNPYVAPVQNNEPAGE